MEFLTGAWLLGLLKVLWVNIILSGDNAVVIAMAARQLHGGQRNKAIVWGAAGAVVLRLIFAAVITVLTGIPFLLAAGGVLLLWIAWKLVQEEPDEEGIEAGQSVWEAVRIIILADAVMSLDNVIALVIASNEDFVLLTIGLVTTIPLVIFGATLLATVLERFPILVYAGAGLLAYLSVETFFKDVALHHYLAPYENIEWLIGLSAGVIFIVVAWLWARRNKKPKQA